MLNFCYFVFSTTGIYDASIPTVPSRDTSLKKMLHEQQNKIIIRETQGWKSAGLYYPASPREHWNRGKTRALFHAWVCLFLILQENKMQR